MITVTLGLFGSILGFLVYYTTATRLTPLTQNRVRRTQMLNTMSLPFILSMFIELTTGSKLLAVSLPILTILVFLLGSRPHIRQLDVAEELITSLMSVAMGVMLYGMISEYVMWLLEIVLIVVELLLLFSAYANQLQRQE